MSQNQTKKEALFNEVKGSLFEYLMARRFSQLAGEELKFLQTLDANYLHVLSQQDRMIRQFYPEMLTFLNQVSELSVNELIKFLGEVPRNPVLRGKFETVDEADLMLDSSRGIIPLSLKLNKKNSYVNTKSGGIKSFFDHYFSFIAPETQQNFNRFVDQEFGRMSHELHTLNDMEFSGHYTDWVKAGKSELPGELDPDERKILKTFYARIATEIHRILTLAKQTHSQDFFASLPALLGFSTPEILQLVCFHDFKSSGPASVSIHPYSEVEKWLKEAYLAPFSQTSSVEIHLGSWSLQIRVKPMNKFTTTAIKINCSVRFRPTEGT
jgi:hypothetical protein